MQEQDQAKRRQQQKRRRWNNRVTGIKVTVFFGVLLLLSLIGLLWFARPSTSTLEKRELTKFPKLTWSSFWDGSFFSGLDKWYADTYPLRESMIGAEQRLKNAYGIRGTQLSGNQNQVAETIPTGTQDLEELVKQTEPTDQPTESTQETLPDGTIKAPLEQVGSIYIADHQGFGLYYFGQKNSARYCLAINSLADSLKGTANVYSLIAPISAGVMLDKSVIEQTGSSDEEEAINWMYANMDENVKTVSVFETLRAHNAEYIYFHTDHHWTALGAYYAYTDFCKAKGIEPHALSSFKTYTFPDYLGTFYSGSNQSEELGSNPDTITAYIPNGTNLMKTYMSNHDGTYTEYDWNIVFDVSDYDKSALYSTFTAGDQPYSYAHNPEIHDGSSVVLVKDSYGNAFLPFLVDHYEHIYLVDFRYYKSYCEWAGIADPSLEALVRDKGIQDVIVLNNIYNTAADELLPYLEELCKSNG